MEMNHILVVEDDKEIREGVKIYLQSQGYEVFLAADGVEGLEVMEKEEIHLAIVDIMMPRMDGIRMTMKLREKYDFPVIMLSAKSEEVDKIMGLNIGADDYVTKPFTPMELMARVNSQLRRYRRFMEKLEVRENVHIIGGLEINEDTVEVSIDGKPVKLTPIEYKILLLLAKNPGRVFSAEEIYERVWQEKAINTDTIMVHVRNIREKIELDPKNPKYLKVVWGVGYKKLKNNNKKGNFLAVLILLIASIGMLCFYPSFSSSVKDENRKEMRKEEQMIEMLYPVLKGNYFLYNEISNEVDSSDMMEEYRNSQFGLMKKYMKYGLFDESGIALIASDESGEKLLEEFNSGKYALCIRFSFDYESEISEIQVGGTAYNKELQFSAERRLYNDSLYTNTYLSTPTDVDIVYAMTEKNLEAYLEQEEMPEYVYVDELMQQPSFFWSILTFVVLSAAAAFVIPQYRNVLWKRGQSLIHESVLWKLQSSSDVV